MFFVSSIIGIDEGVLEQLRQLQQIQPTSDIECTVHSYIKYITALRFAVQMSVDQMQFLTNQLRRQLKVNLLPLCPVHILKEQRFPKAKCKHFPT